MQCAVHVEVKCRVVVYVDCDDIEAAKQEAVDIVGEHFELALDQHLSIPQNLEGEILENRAIWVDQRIESTK